MRTLHVEHSDIAITLIQEQLKMWAAWVKQAKNPRLGYPAASPYVVERMDKEYQGVISAPEAEKVERAMCRLKVFNYQIYLALFCWYYHGMDRQAASDYCRCSKAMFDARKRNGEWYLIGVVS